MSTLTAGRLPVVVIGAGPIGLAAAHLVERGIEPLVLEAGPSAATAEQVRSVAASLAGDQEAAQRVELTLPETGVCGGAGLFDDPDAARSGEGGGCCAAPTTLQIGIGAPASSGGGC